MKASGQQKTAQTQLSRQDLTGNSKTSRFALISCIDAVLHERSAPMWMTHEPPPIVPTSNYRSPPNQQSQHNPTQSHTPFPPPAHPSRAPFPLAFQGVARLGTAVPAVLARPSSALPGRPCRAAAALPCPADEARPCLEDEARPCLRPP